jgi:hypothetical protein
VRPSRAGHCHAFSENALKLYRNAQLAAIRELAERVNSTEAV